MTFPHSPLIKLVGIISLTAPSLKEAPGPTASLRRMKKILLDEFVSSHAAAKDRAIS